MTISKALGISHVLMLYSAGYVFDVITELTNLIGRKGVFLQEYTSNNRLR